MHRRLLQRFSGLCAGVAALCLMVPAAQADVRVPNIFSNSMVLQQQQENRIWGKADAGESVTVRIADQEHSTTADDDGNWHVMLAPLNVGEPRELVIQGNNEIRIQDVLIGEVWICSGQSNMAWKVQSAEDFELERLAADYPQIRMINFPQVGSQEPVWSHEDHTWMVASPENIGQFSAVGYFFGRQLHQTLDVPVGLINNAWGGSAVEAWIPRDRLQADSQFEPLLQRWQETQQQYEALANKQELSDGEKRHLENLRRQMSGNHRPANIYNGVLKSHLGYGIRGAIWYQGESNASRAYQYRELFPLMISTWRDEWGQGDFPFYWVQLADFRAESDGTGDSDWAELREAQTVTMDRLPNTGQAVIIDIGEGKDIHPRNKVDVGRRLARWALAEVYGKHIAHQSPRYKSMEKAGEKIILSFDHLGGGWRPFDVNQPLGFSIAGEDRKFYPAEARILDDNRIEVHSDQVENPVAVRYGWADNPVVNLYGQSDLPLTPFRTDDWPGITADAK